MSHAAAPREDDGSGHLVGGNPRGWWYVLRRAVFEFRQDQLFDRAAALTFFSVLSIFPALVALVSILGLVGQGRATTDAVLEMLEESLPAASVEQLRRPIESITENQGAGLGLVVGLLVAFWTASNYVYAFSRAMNGVYGVREGRPLWKLRPMMYALTVALILLVAASAIILVVSGPIAEWLGDLVGLGSTAVTVWNLARFPALALLVVVILGLLYYATPNVRPGRVRWLSTGAALAIVGASLATVGLGLYVSNFGRFNATYGALAGVIVLLLWLWLSNLAILFGAEVDAELERRAELLAGRPAERTLDLPMRSRRMIEKDRRREVRLVARAQELRVQAQQDQTGRDQDRQGEARPGKDRQDRARPGPGSVPGDEEVLDPAAEHPRDPEGQRQGRVEAPLLDRDDRLSRDPDLGGQPRL